MTDEDAAYGAGACAGAEDDKAEHGHSSGLQGKALARHHGCPVNGNLLSAKDAGVAAGRFESANINFLNNNPMDKSQSRAGHGGVLGRTDDQTMDMKGARDGIGAPVPGRGAEVMKAGRLTASGYSSGFHPCKHII